MNLTKKTISGAFVRIFSLVSKGFMQLAMLIFFARYLSPQEFGIISIATSALVFISLFTEVGLGPALIQKISINNKHISVVFFSSLFLSVLIYIVLFITSPFIAHFYNEPILEKVIQLIGFSFIFSSLGLVSFSLLKKELEFKKIMVIDLISFFLSYCCLGVILVFNDFGLWAYIFSTVAQCLISSLLFLFFKPFSIRFRIYKREFLELFHFAGGLTLGMLFNTLGRQGDVFTTGKLLGIVPLGIYGRANQLMDIPNQYLGQALDNVLFPAMSKRQNDKLVLANTYLRGLSIINLFMIPFSVFIIFYSDDIINLIFGSKWSASGPILQLLCFTLTFKTTVKITDSLVRALGSFYPAALNKFIFACSIVAFTYIGSWFGLYGIAIGVTFPYY